MSNLRIPNSLDPKSWTTILLKAKESDSSGMYIDAISDSIKEINDYEHSTNLSHGAEVGSDTKYMGESGKKLTFNSIVPNYATSPHGREHRVRDYAHLVGIAKKTPYYLVSNSYADYNGTYIVMKCDREEDEGGNFYLNWELQELIVPKVVEKTFRVFGTAKTTSSSTTSKKTTPKKTTASSNTFNLLNNCPVMRRKDLEFDKKGNKRMNITCVKRLQKFMQDGGYYTKYKLDGWFSKYTENELAKVQKNRKLKITGVWDNQTIEYYKKLYKITVNFKVGQKVSTPVKVG